ncbi:MAG: LysM peptidoglycan-binding domain-containing protein [Pseudomonadota bacterium]
MFPVFFSKYWVRVALVVTTVLFALPQGLPARTPEPKEQISHDAEFYHTVQKGDTLWDISKKFFGNAVIWPDLWQKNDQLPNPHWIYPGQKLRLYVRDGVAGFEVVNKFPSDPPPLTSLRDNSSSYHYSLIDQVGFIRSPAVEPHGVLFKSKDDKEMISRGDMVYIRPEKEHQLLPGEKYTVFRTLFPFGNKKDAEEIGLQHYISGIVEITDQQPGLAVATVIQSFRSIEVNDLLMPYHPKSPDIDYRDGKKGLEGHLLQTEEHYELIGHEMVGFIDKGAQDGVETGQSYVLYYREKEEKPAKTMNAPLLPAIELGAIIVLHTENTTATVLVTRSDRDITPGINFRASTN